jgi:hypothetical protein
MALYELKNLEVGCQPYNLQVNSKHPLHPIRSTAEDQTGWDGCVNRCTMVCGMVHMGVTYTPCNSNYLTITSLRKATEANQNVLPILTHMLCML